LQEIGGQSGVKGLREDNVLFLLASKLKDIAVEQDIFILTSTQLNGDYKTSKTPDQNLLRGSKAIADRVDVGQILLPVTSEDLEALQPLIEKLGVPTPNLKLSTYKNRRGRYKDIYQWLKADLGTCRVNTLFCTDYNYEFIDIYDTNITVIDKKGSAF
jgi:replicative DNA helicase